MNGLATKKNTLQSNSARLQNQMNDLAIKKNTLAKQ
jgi:hypothetical protein